MWIKAHSHSSLIRIQIQDQQYKMVSTFGKEILFRTQSEVYTL